LISLISLIINGIFSFSSVLIVDLDALDKLSMHVTLLLKWLNVLLGKPGHLDRKLFKQY